MTEDDLERMKREERDLPYQPIPIQCTKPLEVVARTTVILDKFGHNAEAMQLKGW